MEGVFTYNKYVTGKNFVGRVAQTRSLTNLLINGENVVIYSAPKAGKMSLIQQSLVNLRTIDNDFLAPTFSLMNIRSSEDFICRFGSEVLRCCAQTQSDYAALVEKFFPNSAFVFDPMNYARNFAILSTRSSLQDSDAELVMKLPYLISEYCKKRIIVLLLEFQNIMLFDNGEHYLKLFEKVIKEQSSENKTKTSFIFSGSKFNAMHDIFGIKKYFYRNVERIELTPIDTREIIEHVQRNLLMGGKVIDKEMLLGVCTLFQDNIFHINHFFSICDSFTRGYITEPTLQSSLSCILAIHEGEYKSTMGDLTNYQVRLLQAILDGHIHLTNTDVIEDYRLNSSANVRRLKDALCKKEIIYFNSKNEPKLLDPLFEYWVRKFFFEQKDL